MEAYASNTKLRSLLMKGWLYRGEGNANLVLSLPKLHRILRIKKSDKPTSIFGWLFHWLIQIFQWDTKKDLEYEKKNLQFYNKIMIPLLGAAYVKPAKSVNTTQKDIQRLDKELMPIRPAHRRHKHLQYGTATLFIDYAFLPKESSGYDLTTPIYAVEIKPKQGWIPLQDKNTNRCQFCLNQYLKLKNLQIKNVSSYCPLDLFSGEKQRMLKALKSLVLNPQNNLRLFKDGIYVYGENASLQTFNNVLTECFQETLMEDFCELIVQALLEDFDKNDGCVNCDNDDSNETYVQDGGGNGCVFSESRLPRGSVLERILSLQKLYRMGLNKYKDMYEALIRNKFLFDDWSYVEKLLREIGKKKCPKCVIIEREKSVENELSDLDLVPYLLAAVANDCSFMVTFKKIHNNHDKNRYVLTVKNNSFLVNVGIFDLYPKPSSTIVKHIQRNLKVQNAFILKNSFKR